MHILVRSDIAPYNFLGILNQDLYSIYESRLLLVFITGDNSLLLTTLIHFFLLILSTETAYNFAALPNSVIEPTTGKGFNMF